MAGVRRAGDAESSSGSSTPRNATRAVLLVVSGTDVISPLFQAS